jgi:hypothetical protein
LFFKKNKLLQTTGEEERVEFWSESEKFLKRQPTLKKVKLISPCLFHFNLKAKFFISFLVHLYLINSMKFIA